MNALDWSQAHMNQMGFLSRRKLGNFINGQEVFPQEGKYVGVVDPATEMEIAQAPDSTAADVDAAVSAARACFEHPTWSGLRPADREHLLYRLSILIEAHADELSALETLQCGKLQSVARMIDVGAAAEFVRYMAGWATKLEGQTLQPSIGGPPGVRYHTYTQREPVGVVAAVVPWNFSLAIALWKIAPALAAGCTVVVKPAPETPLTTLRLAQLAVEAGFPPGALNVICGEGNTGAALISHPGINKISFTGSTTTGIAIGHAALENMARITLEMGGKSPAIVLKDVDVQKAAEGVAMGIFFNQEGQVCTAGSRVYVHRSVFEPLVGHLVQLARGMKLGSGFDPSTQIGPLASRRHFDRVMAHIDAAKAGGAKVLTGGQRSGTSGCFIEPTVLVGVTQDMPIAREEVFGPVVVLIPFDDIDEAVTLANDSRYGLSASVWSNDLSAVHRLIPRLQAGMVWVNCHNMLDNNLPLGGYKHLGVGKDLGRLAVESYTEVKSVCMAV